MACETQYSPVYMVLPEPAVRAVVKSISDIGYYLLKPDMYDRRSLKQARNIHILNLLDKRHSNGGHLDGVELILHGNVPDLDLLAVPPFTQRRIEFNTGTVDGIYSFHSTFFELSRTSIETQIPKTPEDIGFLIRPVDQVVALTPRESCDRIYDELVMIRGSMGTVLEQGRLPQNRLSKVLERLTRFKYQRLTELLELKLKNPDLDIRFDGIPYERATFTLPHGQGGKATFSESLKPKRENEMTMMLNRYLSSHR